MRKYAVLYNHTGPSWSIIFRDDTDPEDKWFVLQDDVRGDENASTIVSALNYQENGD